jgi:predicted aspartyl protease
MSTRVFHRLVLAACLGAAASLAAAVDFGTKVPMVSKGAATYYVPGSIEGFGAVELMVDTGSGYMTINEEALAQLKGSNNAQYVKDLRGVLANGHELVVPVYRLTGVNIGGQCWIKDVEAAVFPGKTRFILGLSALKKASPFIFSMEPAALSLSNCAPMPINAALVNEAPGTAPATLPR